MVYGLAEGYVTGPQKPDDTSTKLRRVAQLAKEIRDEGLKNISHHMDLEFLREAYRRTRKDGATGVDGVTAAEYEQKLEENLQALLTRAHSGTYRAPPVRRVEIPKGTGKETRPIGIPTFEDKVLQRAVAMLLEAVYEGEFQDFSYGFRPQRSAHQALEALKEGTMSMYGGWVVEVDIRKFFDTIDHARLREILHKRVLDGVVLRLIGKWLNAGVLTANELTYPERGTPQGGVISPLLANIFLDEVMDKWWVAEILPRLKGRGILVRYADDLVMVFERRTDAERMMRALPQRFAKYGLTLHPEKTRMVQFQPEDKRYRDPDDPPSPPGSFDFLGFTHYWGKTRNGKWMVKGKTAGSRFQRTLVKLNQWLRQNRHKPVPWQHHRLKQSLQGHYAYFGLTYNGRALRALKHEAERLWRKWLSRRSSAGVLSWAAFAALLQRFPLPPARLIHSAYQGARP